MALVEVKDMMMNMERQMNVGTARGRATVDGRAISLKPSEDQVEQETKARIDIYLGTVIDLADRIRCNRAGITDEELESLEFIREQIIDLAKSVSMKMITARVEGK